MFLTIIISVFVTMWVVFCVVMYGYHYFTEVFLDLPVIGQSPCSAHTSLKQIIERVLKESLQLPHLNQISEETEDPEREKTYEELLATAILNKVIANSQNRAGSSRASTSSRLSGASKRSKYEKNYFFGNETINDKWKSTDLDDTSNSSGEEFPHSDSSFGSSIKYVDRVSLKIQQCIDEPPPQALDDPHEEFEYFRPNPSLSDDDSNWVLQKRNFYRASPVPVPMLVPNPTMDTKVLIGDKEVDDTSDLSDAGSDYDDAGSVPAINKLLVDSRTLIGGRNAIGELYVVDKENSSSAGSSADSGVRDDLGLFSESKDGEEDILDGSLCSSIERNAECEEYATLPKTALLRESPILTSCNIIPDITPPKFDDPDGHKEQFIDDSDPEDELVHFEGHYSKREKEKWSHPVVMSNNPYSKENLEKRFEDTSYDRDYYLKKASLPSGQRKPDEAGDRSWIKTPLETQEPEQNIYRAVPTIIDEDSIDSVAEISISSTNNENAAASDSDLSFINCYDVENSKVFHQSPTGEKTEIRTSVNEVEAVLPPDELKSGGPEMSIKLNRVEPLSPPLDFKDFPEIAEPTERNPMIFPVVKKRTKLHETENSSALKIVNRKSDNTLIKKIYSDPVVRSFALKNGHQIPDYSHQTVGTPPTEAAPPKFHILEKTYDFGPKEILATPPKFNTSHQLPDFEHQPNEIVITPKNEAEPPTFLVLSAPPKVSLPFTSTPKLLAAEFSDEINLQKIEHEEDINDLKDKGLVASRLGQFSKSFPNLAKSPTKPPGKIHQRKHESEESLIEAADDKGCVSVRELRRRFEKDDVVYNIRDKHVQVHSLTARSLSKQMREQLKLHDPINGEQI